MRRIVLPMTCLLLIAAAPVVADWSDDLVPDAGLYAQTVLSTETAASVGIEGLSWEVGAVSGRRLWADLIKPLDAPGLAASVDLTPGRSYCAGVGYQHTRGAVLFVGAHLTW